MMLLKPNESRSKLAIQLLLVVMTLDFISLFSNVLEYQLITSGAITIESAHENDMRQRIISIIQILVFITSVVTFIRWFRRAYYNLHERQILLEHSEKEAATCWFIPFICLFKPYRITKEIFNETDNYLFKNLENYKSTIAHYKIGLWWTFWIILNIIGNISFRISLNAKTIDDIITASYFNIFCDIIAVPTAIFAILMIKEYAKIETLFYTTEIKKTNTEEPETSFELPNN